MMMFKACPKCGGDLYLREDFFGRYQDCFQCGYLQDIRVESEESEKDRELSLDNKARLVGSR